MINNKNNNINLKEFQLCDYSISSFNFIQS